MRLWHPARASESTFQSVSRSPRVQLPGSLGRPCKGGFPCTPVKPRRLPAEWLASGSHHQTAPRMRLEGVSGGVIRGSVLHCDGRLLAADVVFHVWRLAAGVTLNAGQGFRSVT